MKMSPEDVADNYLKMIGYIHCSCDCIKRTRPSNEEGRALFPEKNSDQVSSLCFRCSSLMIGGTEPDSQLVLFDYFFVPVERIFFLSGEIPASVIELVDINHAIALGHLSCGK